jgi:hypothetical protein
MLDNLLGARSFSTMVGHLVHHQIIVFASSKGLNLLLMMQLVAPTFLGCWALIAPTFNIRF